MSTVELDFPPITGAATAAINPIVATAATGSANVRDAAVAHLRAQEATIRAVAERFRAVALDLSTPKGLAAGQSALTELREQGRFAVQRARDATKDLLNGAKKDVEAEAERLIAIVKPVEDHIEAQVTARKKVLEDEKRERERIEQERVARHQARLATIRACAAKAEGISSERVANGIAAVESIVIDADVWEEFFGQANAAKDETLAAMRALHVKALADEHTARENERIRQENEALRAQLAAAQKPAPVAEAQAPITNTEAQNSQQVLKAEAATPDATARENSATASPSVGSMGASQPADAGAPEKVSPATQGPIMTTGKLNERLGFTLTTSFLTGLGVTPAQTQSRTGTFWRESDFKGICALLVKHIQGLAQ